MTPLTQTGKGYAFIKCFITIYGLSGLDLVIFGISSLLRMQVVVLCITWLELCALPEVMCRTGKEGHGSLRLSLCPLA